MNNVMRAELFTAFILLAGCAGSVGDSGGSDDQRFSSAEATLLDFRLACTVVSKLAHGVWVNVGSAVLLPEVFLKAVTVARNTGHAVEDLTTADLDMLPHYRPATNVVKRPPARGYSLMGHHEILVPLLRMAVLAEVAP